MTSATAPEPVLAVADQCIDLGYSCANIECTYCICKIARLALKVAASGITLPTEPFPDMAVDLEHFFDLCIADDTVSTTDAAANSGYHSMHLRT